MRCSRCIGREPAAGTEDNMPISPFTMALLAEADRKARKEALMSDSCNSCDRVRIRMKDGSTVAIEILDADGQVMAVVVENWQQGKLLESSILGADGNQLATLEYQWDSHEGNARVTQLVLKSSDGSRCRQLHLELQQVTDPRNPHYPVVVATPVGSRALMIPTHGSDALVEHPANSHPLRFGTSMLAATVLLAAYALPSLVTGAFFVGGMQLLLSLFFYWNSVRSGQAGLRERFEEHIWSWIDHADAAKTFLKWSEQAFEQGDNREGERLLEKAVRLEPKHYRQAVALLLKQGQKCLKNHKVDEAERQLSRALEIHQQQKLNMLGVAAECAHELAGIHHSRGQLEKAIELRTLQVTFSDNMAGSERNARYAQSVCALGELHQEKGLFDLAESLFQKAVDVGNKVRLDDESTAWYSIRLGLCHLRHGKHSSAEYLFHKAFELLQRSDSDRNDKLAVCLYGWAASLNGGGRQKESESLFMEAAELYRSEKSLGREHALMRECFQAYADFLRSNGRESEATLWERRAQSVGAVVLHESSGSERVAR